MAITINQSPIQGNLNPVYNDVGYSVSSDNTAQANFKYICDVYPAGVTAPIRMKQPADPVTGYCYFDVSGILKSYITRSPLDIGYLAFSPCTESWNQYTVKFGEEYGPSSGTVVYPNLTTSSSTAFNASLNFLEFVDGPTRTMASYELSNSSSKFLTFSPRTINVTTTDAYGLYFRNDSAAAYNVVIKTYTSAGVLIQTVKFGSNYTTNDKILAVGAGPYYFNLLTGTETRFSGALPVISATTSYYTVWLENSGGTQISETFRFNIIDGCSKYGIYRLQFLNRLGGYDCFTFYGAPQKTSEITREFFKQRQGGWVSNIFTYNLHDRSKSQYNTIIQDSIKLTSDWITEAESTWLEELVSSPDVKYYDTTYEDWIPCTINDNYVFKTTARDTLFNLELTIQPSFNRYRQQW